MNSTDIRKGIARVLTVINSTQRSHLRLLYEKKKYTPLDLRPKLTRAIRRQLTPKEKAKKTEKAKKKQIHYPQRRFAVKV
jgi:large subunit ribosomal protein L35e